MRGAGGALADAPAHEGAVQARATTPAPGPTRTFSSPQNTAGRLLSAVAVAVAATLVTARFFATGHTVGPAATGALWPLGAVVAWTAAYKIFQRWARPLRLSTGPDGVTMREFAGVELAFAWDQIAAVTVGPGPEQSPGPTG